MKFNATHRRKVDFRYVQEISRKDGDVVFSDIVGMYQTLTEPAFEALYEDLSKFRGLDRGLFGELDSAEESNDSNESTPFRRYTEGEIGAAASPSGGYGKKELLSLGVIWPPKRGWREALLAGLDPNNPPARIKSARAIEGDTELLARVVVDIAEQGYAHLLYHIPGLLDRFGARLPEKGEIPAIDSTFPPR